MTSTFVPTGKELPFANGRFLLIHRLGSGSFGDIFEGYDNLTARRVAVKLEKKKVAFPLLPYEGKVYRILHQPVRVHGGDVDASVAPPPPPPPPPVAAAAMLPLHAATSSGSNATHTQQQQEQQQQQQLVHYAATGVPLLYHVSAEGDYNVLVMELCGPSLEELFNYCHRRFSLKTVLMLADQMLTRMEFFHDKGFVHRDIKPENFVMGDGAKGHLVYIIDFGLSKLYWYVSKNVHMPFAEGKSLTGTARYCSVNTHRGYEQSRRDDLESVGYLLIYFLRSSLPWQGMQARDQASKTTKIGEKKMSTPLDQLCKGLPSEFLRYVDYCRKLSFQERPDYDYLRGMFRSLGRRCGAARAGVCATSITPHSASNGTAASGSGGAEANVHMSQHRLGGWCSTSGNSSNTGNNNNNNCSGSNHVNHGNSPIGAAAAVLLNKTGRHRTPHDLPTAGALATAAVGSSPHILVAGRGGGDDSSSSSSSSNDSAVNDKAAAAAMMTSAVAVAANEKDSDAAAATGGGGGGAMTALQSRAAAGTASRVGSAAYYAELVREGARDAVGFYDWCFDWIEKRAGEVDAARVRVGLGGGGSSHNNSSNAVGRDGNGSGRGGFVATAQLR